VRQYTAKIYLIEHLRKTEKNRNIKDFVSNRAKKVLGKDVIILSEELQEHLYPPFECYSGFFADIYAQMDLVLGMRGHSNIVAFGKNTPVIGIGQHNKVKWFLEDVGLADHTVRLDSTDSEDADLLMKKSRKFMMKRSDQNTFENMANIKDDFVKRMLSV
jgi:polysaccharide pyruvyl transferase WcaK-like protein